MSLDRTALRLAAVMALTNGFTDPFPTVAGGRVYDSRIDPIQGLQNEDLVPIIIVTSEDHTGDALSPTSGGPAFNNVVDLILDVSIGMFKEGDVYSIASEPELEAALDQFEWQVMRALWRAPLSPWARWFFGEPYSVVRRVDRWRSSVFREREGNQRLSARQLIIQCQMQPDPDFDVASEARPPTIPAPLGPLLTAVIADAGPYAITAQAMQDTIIGHPQGLSPVVLTPLERVRLFESDHVAVNEDDEPAGKRHAGVSEADLT